MCTCWFSNFSVATNFLLIKILCIVLSSYPVLRVNCVLLSHCNIRFSYLRTVVSQFLVIKLATMEDNSATSTPSDVSGRRVSDTSGTRRRLQDPPDPLDDPVDVSCSISLSCSRTGSPHATAVDISSPESYPEVDFPKLRRGTKGKTVSRELCNLDETIVLAEAQSNLQEGYLDGHGHEPCRVTSGLIVV